MTKTDEDLYNEFLYEQFQQSQGAPAPQTALLGDDDPMMEFAPREQAGKDRSPTDVFVGALEALGTAATSVFAAPAAVYGALDGAVGSYFAGHDFGSDEFNSNMKARQDEVIGKSMYQPQTEAGQEYAGVMGETIAPLEVLEPFMPALAGMGTMAQIGGRLDAHQSGVTRNLDGPSDIEVDMKKRVEAARTGGESLPSGERLSVGAAKAADDVAPQISPDIAATSLNRYFGPEVAEMYRDASPSTREQMINMLNVAENATPGSGVDKLPRQIIGDTVAARASTLANARQRYGERIEQIVEGSYEDRVNTAPLADSFGSILDKYKISRNDDGTFDLNGSRISSKEANSVLGDIYERMESKIDNQESTFGQLHTDKQWLQDMADYDLDGKGGKGQLNKAIKDMATSVNDLLRYDGEGNPTPYGEANSAFSSTVKPFEEIARLSGAKRPDFSDPKAVSELARKSRGLTNNTKTGVELDYTLRDMEKLIGEGVENGVISADEMAAIGFNPKTMKFDADINKMGHFASTVDAVFPQLRPTSLAGIMDQNSNAINDGMTMALDGITGGKSAVARMGIKAVDKLTDGGGTKSRIQKDREAREEVVRNLFNLLER